MNFSLLSPSFAFVLRQEILTHTSCCCAMQLNVDDYEGQKKEREKNGMDIFDTVSDKGICQLLNKTWKQQ
jgi:hypothetical protein